MVSTRASTRAESVGPDASVNTPTATTPPPTASKPKRAKKPASSSSSSKAAGAAGSWAHAPTFWTLLWMGVSLPLVIWDTGYVLGRPHTMEGGFLHVPLYQPYKLYGEVDHVYGWKAFNAGNGFTSAQGLLNAVETLMYFWYLYICSSASGAAVTAAGKKAVVGRAGARAVLVGFSAAVMTLSKTVLYWANEYYSGFDNIGHNSTIDLIFLWIIPNGAWLVGPTYMIYSLGAEILDGLEVASTHIKSE